jgi:hypothetical protein
VNAHQNPQYEFPQAVDWILRQLAQFGRVPCSSVIRTPALAAPLGAGLASPPLQMRFNEPGIVIALYGQEAAATPASFAGTEIRIQMDGVEDVIQDGQSTGGTTFPLLGLVGGAQNWFPIMRRASVGMPWLITWKNTTAGPITPSAGFAFIADRFLSAVLPARK